MSSGGCWVAEAVPLNALTPQEHSVELIRVLTTSREPGSRLPVVVLPVLVNPEEKPFLVLNLIKEYGGVSLRNEGSKALILVPNHKQSVPWGDFLRRNSNLKIAVYDKSQSQEKEMTFSNNVLITDFESIEFLPWSLVENVSLFVLDNAHSLPTSSRAFAIYSHLKNKETSSLILPMSAFLFAKDENFEEIQNRFGTLESSFASRIETSCDVMTVLRYVAKPKFGILTYTSNIKDPKGLEIEIKKILTNLISFLKDHSFSLMEIYEEFEDEIAQIPDPVILPLKLIDDFLRILDTCGIWCAERAALLLTLKIDKLRSQEKYDRHYLLLIALHTEMMKIRKIIDDALFEVSEIDRLTIYSKQKLIRMMEIFLRYKPDHVGRRRTNVEVEEEKEVVESQQEKIIVKSKRKGVCSYNDPNALCGVVFVKDSFMARILYHYLKDYSRMDEKFSFLTPQYAAFIGDSPEDTMDQTEEGLDRKREESLRRFRMKECNVLISNSNLEVGIDSVRCNLILAFDPPESFRTWAHYKVKAKAPVSWFLFLCQKSSLNIFLGKHNQYKNVEECLKSNCKYKDPPDDELEESDSYGDSFVPPEYREVLNFKNAIPLLNRYCAKLPSDSFTRLTPLSSVKKTPKGNVVCGIQLPVNSPLKSIILSAPMPTETLAQRSASVQAMIALHKVGEVDESMNTIGKEGTQKLVQRYLRSSPLTVPDKKKEEDEEVEKEETVAVEPSADITKTKSRPGTTKRRQYYDKKTAACLKAWPTQSTYTLYYISLKLICPMPEDQNTRGRKIYPPEESPRKFGFLVQGKIPPICPFPIYTRSGEVLVEINRGHDLTPTPENLNLAYEFHQYIFTKVLRLQKHPMEFSPFRSNNSLLILPLNGKTGEIDWNFLESIRGQFDDEVRALSDEERKDYVFDPAKYEDAVIMPWYRNQDHPQYFYVAETCNHLSPASKFPGKDFESFAEYYNVKYNICVQNLNQPLLDVDHTSRRFNFLTPRYVNRKGVILPTSSQETKKNKRENLDQKQILIPELCRIHPFPASLWRQTVTLPCILYRFNGLLIADGLRSLISSEMRFGVSKLEDDFRWNPLDFGWMLSDVLENPTKTVQEKKKKKMANSANMETTDVLSSEATEPKDKMVSMSEELQDKMNLEEKKLKEKQLEIGTWSNDLATNDKSKKPHFKKSQMNGIQDEYIDEEDLEFLDPKVALPDNLFMLPNSVLLESKKDNSKDWGTGIEQKNFRVGSPTFLDNPNIHIPGLYDDLDGLSCSDSDDYLSDNNSDAGGRKRKNSEPQPEVDENENGRIEFHGERTAEAIEDEAEAKLRSESLAKNREEEALMVAEVPWPEISSCEPLPSRDTSSPVDNCGVQIFDGVKTFELETLESKSDAQNVEEKELKMPEEDVDTAIDMTAFNSELNIVPQKIKNGEDVIRTSGFGIIPRETDEEYFFKFDNHPDLSSHPGPSPSILLQALTMSNSNDAINLERLETIGDSFLKYAVTYYLYNAYDTVHEGRLSILRSKQVSNLNLFKIGKKKKLGQCMIASKFEPQDNWLPPSYYVPIELERALIMSGVPSNLWNTAEFPEADYGSMTPEEIIEIIKDKNQCFKPENSGEKNSSFIPYNLLTQHSIPDKSIADCVEALIGAYLIATGQMGALYFMTWLGLEVLPSVTPKIESPLVQSVDDPKNTLNYFLSGYDEFENLIGYKFRDRSYLLQAFSHASFYVNRLTGCYQRLEFLGDAVLDYLITRHLYEDPRKHCPGAITDLRSALVNNSIFAYLAVKYQFNKYFKHLSPGLHGVIDRFVKLQVQNEYKVIEEFYLMDEDDTEEAEDVEVPKALGDIFESVAGAIFLDSGSSLDTVWRVYYRMMKKEIEEFSANVPKSPIRELLELEPETAKFGKPEKLADGKRVRVSVEIFGRGIFKGIGRNYRIAKCTAAKCALRQINRPHSNKK